jgi:hypothetical protein
MEIKHSSEPSAADQKLFEQWDALNNAARDTTQAFHNTDTDEATAFRAKEQASDNLSRFMRDTPGASVVHDIRLQRKG